MSELLLGKTRMRSILIEDITDADALKWAALAENALEPNAFFHPAFLLRSRAAFDTVDGLRLIVVEMGDRWIALLPLTEMGRFPRTPLRYASTAGPFVGRNAALCAPLVDANESRLAIDALFRYLRSRQTPLPRLIELTLLPADGQLFAELLEGCRRLGIPVQERSRFARAYARGPVDALPSAHLSAARQKQLGRLSRNLAQAAGGPLEFVDLGADPDAVLTLLDLEAAGWKGKKGSAVKMRPGLSEWFVAVTDSFRRSDALHIFTLRAGDATVFMSAVIKSGSIYFGILDSFDETYAKHSPGQIGRLHELAYLLQLGDVTAFDPCMHPKYAEATALYPDRRQIVSLLIAPGWLSGLFLRARPHLLDVRQAIVRLIGSAAAFRPEGISR